MSEKILTERKLVIVDYEFEKVRECEDFIDTHYPNYTFKDVYYYQDGYKNHMRFVLEKLEKPKNF